MELTEFMKKFCVSDTEPFLDENGNKIRGWNIKDFPKALQNFADKICEKQRENCVEAVDYEFMMRIRTSDQPKIDDICV